MNRDKDALFLGVASQLAKSMGASTKAVRWAIVILSMFAFRSVLITYVLLAVIFSILNTRKQNADRRNHKTDKYTKSDDTAKKNNSDYFHMS